MNSNEIKAAKKEIKKKARLLYNDQIREYGFQAATLGVMAGASIASFIAFKSVETVSNPELLNFSMYVQEGLAWLKTDLYPKIQQGNMTGVLKDITPANLPQVASAGFTGLFGVLAVTRVAKSNAKKKEKRTFKEEEINKLR